MDPFPVKADNIFYMTPGINLRRERIKESIVGSQKTIVFTSSPGAGKSTLADYLESQPESNQKICLVQVDDIFNLANILAQVNEIRGNSWYRSQPYTYYTSQLIAGSRIENVVRILEDVPGIHAELSDHVKYTPSGKPRYMIFYDLYADKAAAYAAISSGPAGGEPLVTFNR